MNKKIYDINDIQNRLGDMNKELTAACDEVHHTITHHEYMTTLEKDEASLLLYESHHYFYSTLWFALDCYLNADVRYPRLQQANSVMRRGLDNPDNLYLHAIIDPARNYVIRGRLGDAEDIIFQVWDNLGNITVSSLSSLKMNVDSNGRFEIHVGPDEPNMGLPLHRCNYLANGRDKSGDMVLVRYTYSLWQAVYDEGELAIDCVDDDWRLPGEMNEEKLSQKMKLITQFVKKDLLHWVGFLFNLKSVLPENTMTPLTLLQGDMGLIGLQYNSVGIFSIDEDEALVLTLRETEAGYTGFQLGNLWFQSLNYTRQTSLAMKQAVPSSDGLYRYVISAKDPGIANWVDTHGHRRGCMLLRYQLIPDNVTLEHEKDGPLPLVKVPVKDLAGQFTPEDRNNEELFFPPQEAVSRMRNRIEGRRRHLQKRFNY